MNLELLAVIVVNGAIPAAAVTFAQNKPDRRVRLEDVFTNECSSRIKPVK